MTDEADAIITLPDSDTDAIVIPGVTYKLYLVTYKLY